MAKKLVIIDDSSTQLNVLKTLFANNGWEVCGVQNAKIGFEIIFDFAPDLIITDAIMPLMGGFQLIKLIRENEKISKIPVIVYSILNEANAKFYIKEELSEYFLRKDDNQEKLLALAQEIIEKFPLDEKYKEEILKEGLYNYSIKDSFSQQPTEMQIEEAQEEIIKQEINEERTFNIDEFRNKIKILTDFSYCDEKIILQLFSLFYEELKHNLCVFSLYSFDLKDCKTYFDIRGIILSPILKNGILAKHSTGESVMFKKYAPNLNVIVNESEFLSKIDFDFEYKGENIAKVTFYACDKFKWEDKEKKEQIKEVLFEFLKTRHIKRSSQASANKEDIMTKYALSFGKFDNIKNKTNTYFGIIQIYNFADLKMRITQEEIDVLNSKISEKIIECLDKEEQIYKNDEDEYNVVIYARDKKHAKYRFEYILNELKEIIFENLKIEFLIAAAKCNMENGFNMADAQKQARQMLEDGMQQDKVVVYNAE